MNADAAGGETRILYPVSFLWAATAESTPRILAINNSNQLISITSLISFDIR